MPYDVGLVRFNIRILFFFCCLGIGVYRVMVAGWASNCKYYLLGRLRSVAQTISYEVRLALILLSFIVLLGGFRLELFVKYQNYIWFIFLSLPLRLI